MKNITYQQIIERYTYDDGELYYRENISARARRGQRVGCMDGTGYRILRAFGNNYQYHRIIYCYFNECDYDDISPWEIDHLDNDRSNNRIENLLLCEHWENQLNMITTKRNGGLSRAYYQRNNLSVPDEVRLQHNEKVRRYYHAKKNKEM